jgi:hypothetical protein
MSAESIMVSQVILDLFGLSEGEGACLLYFSAKIPLHIPHPSGQHRPALVNISTLHRLLYKFISPRSAMTFTVIGC